MTGKLHPRNLLNHLTGTEWIRFTRSWFVLNPPRRTASEVQHPAKYPEELAEGFIQFFSQRGQLVLDPFAGVGSTVRAAKECGRRGVGTELNPKYHELALQHTDQAEVFQADARDIPVLWKKHSLPPADLILTSPPYWDMLAHSRGNVLSVHKERKQNGLDVVYSDDPRDLGNTADYEIFLEELKGTFHRATEVLKPKGHVIVVIQNMRSPSGRMVPLAWDLAKKLDEFLIFKAEKIWCQDNKRLGIWGYPSEFVSNVHHHYCLIFKKPG